jgi:hypothetical protein
MPPIGRQLRKQFESLLRHGAGSILLPAEASGGAGPDPDLDFRAMAASGHDPLHAIYASTVNLLSTLLESLVEVPSMAPVLEFWVTTQELYAPGYPPMSPITQSFYVTWTLFDVPFGSGQETVGDLVAGVADLLQLGAVRESALTQLRGSRLGIFQIGSSAKNRARLRELVTNSEFDALIPTGFHGVTGDIVLLRLLPPLMGEVSYHVSMTTPYILGGQSEQDWLDYFARHQVVRGAPGAEERLHRHMKAGPKPDYWAEYVFWGYAGHRPDAILVRGMPDRVETLPQHARYAKPGGSPPRPR